MFVTRARHFETESRPVYALIEESASEAQVGACMAHLQEGR